MCEIEVEQIPGLPGKLPEGERLLWQGRPSWRALARRCFKVRAIAIYFAIFAVWWTVSALSEGATWGQALLDGLAVVPVAFLAIAVVAGLAWLTAHNSIYSITSKRVVIRTGIALPMTFNLPFSRIASANMKVEANKSGDIVLALSGRDRIAYAHLWPHARPWHLKDVQPMLRGLPNVQEVGALLSNALAGASAQTADQAESVTAAPELLDKHGKERPWQGEPRPAGAVPLAAAE